MHEVMNHPWMLKGYNGPPENHLPHREPLKLPLDNEIIAHMTGFKFGPPEYIKEELTKKITSPKYQAAARRLEREKEQALPTPKDAEKRRGFGFDFYKRRNSVTSKDTLTNTSSDGLPIGDDPLNAFDPMISIYYLVREKLERERQAAQLSMPPKVQAPPSPQQSQALPVPPSPVVRPKEKHSLAEIVPPQPVHTDDIRRSRQRARSHSEDQVREPVKNGLLSPDMIPPQQQQKKSSGGAVSLLRRLSTRDRKKEPSSSDGKAGSLIQKSVSMRAKSLGHARRESIQARRAKREAEARDQEKNPQTHPRDPTAVREETDAELLGDSAEAEEPSAAAGGETSGGSHERLDDHRHHQASSSEDPDLAKPVYLKGIFSVSTTSTKPLPQIRADIKRVLKMLGVEYAEIKGGFSCSHMPSIAPAVDGDAPFITVTGAGAGGSGGVVERHVSHSYHHERERDRERVAEGEIRFEIVIVKVPIVSLHGVQFKRVGGNTWQYKAMAEQIVRELRL